jgi:hypothetical protein
MTKTFQIVLSTDGKHAVIVTSEDADGATRALGWAQATYDRLLERYGPAVASRSRRRQPGPDEETPDCAVHQVPMIQQEGRRGAFWSCHRRNADGSWCSYKPGER